jgi:hypothetical protein
MACVTELSTVCNLICRLDGALAFLFVSYGNTRKDTLLESGLPGVTTSTSPVAASAGTVVVISELDTTVAPARRAMLTAGQTLARTLHPSRKTVSRVLVPLPLCLRNGPKENLGTHRYPLIPRTAKFPAHHKRHHRLKAYMLPSPEPT